MKTDPTLSGINVLYTNQVNEGRGVEIPIKRMKNRALHIKKRRIIAKMIRESK